MSLFWLHMQKNFNQCMASSVKLLKQMRRTSEKILLKKVIHLFNLIQIFIDQLNKASKKGNNVFEKTNAFRRQIIFYHKTITFFIILSDCEIIVSQYL